MASGDTLVVFGPQENQPPASGDAATLDVRNGHLVLDFADDADDAAIFSSVLPRQYAAGGLTVRLAWMAESATSGVCGWDVAFERHADDADDLDSDFFATSQVGSATTASATGEVKYTDVVFTNSEIDGLLAGEHFRVKVARIPDVPSDLTDDVELLSVEIRET